MMVTRRRDADQQKIDDKERKMRAEAVEYGFASVRMEGL